MPTYLAIRVAVVYRNGEKLTAFVELQRAIYELAVSLILQNFALLEIAFVRLRRHLRLQERWLSLLFADAKWSPKPFILCGSCFFSCVPVATGKPGNAA